MLAHLKRLGDWAKAFKRTVPHAKESKEMMVEMTIPVLKYPVQKLM